MPDDLKSQRGNAIIAITGIGLVMTMAFAAFMTSTVMTEQRAVEGELAMSRTYWAEMGNFDYVMSRISYSKFCGTLLCLTKMRDADMVPVLQAYFNELSNNNVWTYADESSNYSITTNDIAAVDENPLRQTYSGWLKATSTFTASSLITEKLPQMELRLCVGLNNAGAKCGDINNNNGGNQTAYFSVNQLTNLPMP
jgi:hypothetical protein